MNREAIIHIAESLGLTFLGGAVGYVEPMLSAGKLTTDSKAIVSAAIGAGLAAVVARVRGMQFGILRGVQLSVQPPASQVTPAETPQAKGTGS